MAPRLKTACCEVGLNTQQCENPPDSDGLTIRTRCYRCGARACKSCSNVRLSPDPVGIGKVRCRRRIRMCRDCQEQEGILEWAV